MHYHVFLPVKRGCCLIAVKACLFVCILSAFMSEVHCNTQQLFDQTVYFISNNILFYIK